MDDRSPPTSGSEAQASRRLRVGVVLGGRSSEREISLETGRHLVHTLDPVRYDVRPIYMDGAGHLWRIGQILLVQNTTADIDARLVADATPLAYEALPDDVDFVYIGLHGKYGEDGCFQGLLELVNLPFSGSGVLGSALAMDKAVQRRLLSRAGIDVPAHRVVRAAAWESDREAELRNALESPGLPAVVKPAREGCSTGLAVAETAEKLATALDEALSWDNTALVEERLSGTEVTVTVLKEPGAPPRAFAPTETPPMAGFLTIEEKFLPGHGQNITPARLPAEVQELVRHTAEHAFVALGLSSFARIDMYVTPGGRVVVGEPNSLPGSTPSSTVFLGPMEEGIGPRELLTRIVEASLSAHAAKKGPLD
jgi:D-alanine-D-alanine ligase